MWFELGIIASAAYSMLLLPDCVNEAPKLQPTIYPILSRGMIILPVDRTKALHLHHWLLFTCLLTTVDLPEVVAGFSYGLVMQGIEYSDYLQIHTTNPYSYQLTSGDESTPGTSLLHE
jgi:hypothetical protein